MIATRLPSGTHRGTVHRAFNGTSTVRPITPTARSAERTERDSARHSARHSAGSIPRHVLGPTGRRKGKGAPRFPNRASTHQRPDRVEDRPEVGDRAADLTPVRRPRAILLTQLERRARLTRTRRLQGQAADDIAGMRAGTGQDGKAWERGSAWVGSQPPANSETSTSP